MSLDIVKENGIIGFISPKISVNYINGLEVSQKKLEKRLNIKTINLSDSVKEHFGSIGSDFCYAIIENNGNDDGDCTIILNDEKFEEHLEFEEALPFMASTKKEFDIQKSILKKTCNYKNELNRCAARIESPLKDIIDEKYKNKIVQKILTHDIVLKYTNKSHVDIEKYKILLPTVGKNYVLDTQKELFPGTSFVVYITSETIEELYDIEFLITKSKIYKFIENIFSSMRSPRDYVAKIIRKPNISGKWSDEELYEYFELTEEEINYIENND